MHVRAAVHDEASKRHGSATGPPVYMHAWTHSMILMEDIPLHVYAYIKP